MSKNYLNNIVKRKSQEIGGDDNSSYSKPKVPLTREDAKKNQMFERLKKNKKVKELMDEGMGSVIKEKLSGNGVSKTEIKKIFEQMLEEYVRNDKEGMKEVYIQCFNTIAQANMEVLLENVMMSDAFVNKVVEKIMENLE